MYEMALRRQDILELTFNHFKDLEAADDGGFSIRFKCVKQNVEREVSISKFAIEQVEHYRTLK